MVRRMVRILVLPSSRYLASLISLSKMEVSLVP